MLAVGLGEVLGGAQAYIGDLSKKACPGVDLEYVFADKVPSKSRLSNKRPLNEKNNNNKSVKQEILSVVYFFKNYFYLKQIQRIIP